jgi:hypothetical protein
MPIQYEISGQAIGGYGQTQNFSYTAPTRAGAEQMRDSFERQYAGWKITSDIKQVGEGVAEPEPPSATDRALDAKAAQSRQNIEQVNPDPRYRGINPQTGTPWGGFGTYKTTDFVQDTSTGHYVTRDSPEGQRIIEAQINPQPEPPQNTYQQNVVQTLRQQGKDVQTDANGVITASWYGSGNQRQQEVINLNPGYYGEEVRYRGPASGQYYEGFGSYLSPYKVMDTGQGNYGVYKPIDEVTQKDLNTNFGYGQVNRNEISVQNQEPFQKVSEATLFTIGGKNDTRTDGLLSGASPNGNNSLVVQGGTQETSATEGFIFGDTGGSGLKGVFWDFPVSVVKGAGKLIYAPNYFPEAKPKIDIGQDKTFKTDSLISDKDIQNLGIVAGFYLAPSAIAKIGYAGFTALSGYEFVKNPTGGSAGSFAGMATIPLLFKIPKFSFSVLEVKAEPTALDSPPIEGSGGKLPSPEPISIPEVKPIPEPKPIPESIKPWNHPRPEFLSNIKQAEILDVAPKGLKLAPTAKPIRTAPGIDFFAPDKTLPTPKGAEFKGVDLVQAPEPEPLIRKGNVVYTELGIQKGNVLEVAPETPKTKKILQFNYGSTSFPLSNAPITPENIISINSYSLFGKGYTPIQYSNVNIEPGFLYNTPLSELKALEGKTSITTHTTQGAGLKYDSILTNPIYESPENVGAFRKEIGQGNFFMTPDKNGNILAVGGPISVGETGSSEVKTKFSFFEPKREIFIFRNTLISPTPKGILEQGIIKTIQFQTGEPGIYVPGENQFGMSTERQVTASVGTKDNPIFQVEKNEQGELFDKYTYYNLKKPLPDFLGGKPEGKVLLSKIIESPEAFVKESKPSIPEIKNPELKTIFQELKGKQDIAITGGLARKIATGTGDIRDLDIITLKNQGKELATNIAAKHPEKFEVIQHEKFPEIYRLKSRSSGKVIADFDPLKLAEEGLIKGENEFLDVNGFKVVKPEVLLRSKAIQIEEGKLTSDEKQYKNIAQLTGKKGIVEDLKDKTTNAPSFIQKGWDLLTSEDVPIKFKEAKLKQIGEGTFEKEAEKNNVIDLSEYSKSYGKTRHESISKSLRPVSLFSFDSKNYESIPEFSYQKSEYSSFKDFSRQSSSRRSSSGYSNFPETFSPSRGSSKGSSQGKSPSLSYPELFSPSSPRKSSGGSPSQGSSSPGSSPSPSKSPSTSPSRGSSKGSSYYPKIISPPRPSHSPFIRSDDNFAPKMNEKKSQKYGYFSKEFDFFDFSKSARRKK